MNKHNFNDPIDLIPKFNNSGLNVYIACPVRNKHYHSCEITEELGKYRDLPEIYYNISPITTLITSMG